MGMPQFTYFRPETIPEFEELLFKHRDRARILAGGTDLMVQMKAGLQAPSVLIDMGALDDLRGISHVRGKGTTILAGTKIAALEHSPQIKKKLPALLEAVRLLGSSQVRFMATLGGNACNASPSAETPPILMALEAKVRVAGKSGERTLPLEDFFLEYRRVDLKSGEYLKAFFIPEQPPRAGSAYLCRMLRSAMEIDMVNTGVRITLDPSGRCREARIGLGSVAPIPLRARKAEDFLKGKTPGENNLIKAGEMAAREARPIDDIRGSAQYRQEMVKVMVVRALKAATDRAKKRIKD